jgi:hypothetical protein
MKSSHGPSSPNPRQVSMKSPLRATAGGGGTAAEKDNDTEAQTLVAKVQLLERDLERRQER